MTPLSLYTTATSSATLISVPSVSSLGKKMTNKEYIAFSFVPKQSSRRSATKLFSIDWDLNMNELEFE